MAICSVALITGLFFGSVFLGADTARIALTLYVVLVFV